MHPTPKLARSGLHWLSSLKSTQLQQIARATGIQSSGTKAILSARIERALRPHLPQYGKDGSLLDGRGDGGSARREQGLRVLSIDMGIRNMAFAVLRVPQHHGSSSSSSGNGGGISAHALSLSTPELVAWRRLAVSEIGCLDLDLGDSLLLSGSGQLVGDSSITPNTKREISSQTPISEITTSSTPSQQNPKDPIEKEKEKEIFSPHLYAKTAYTLITTLLHAYNPTHILIERQRFRSGGASAVQEWTLRVGVLEGMLYAVLETLGREGRLGGSEREGVRVWGVEPKRVVGFWGDVAAGEGGGGDGRKRVSAKEVKRGKIDLVGRWLDVSFAGGGSGSGKIVIPDDNTVVKELASAYLRRWRGENGRKKDSTGDIPGGEIGKLDDLADCLLQGVTWLEWQVKRERLAREGVEALKGMR